MTKDYGFYKIITSLRREGSERDSSYLRIRSKDFEYDAKRVITKRQKQNGAEVMIPVNDSIEEMQKVTFDFEKGQTLHKANNSGN